VDPLRFLADRLLRIDARSLGLFRIAMGLVLLGDWLVRWRWLESFYSNEGVLPNHNHLFNLQDGQRQVWSLLHAFSTTDENRFAFLVALFIYLCFLFGWHTRAFHVLSAVALVSMSARNVLAEGAGNSVAIALLLGTVVLPLGDRFSLDALSRSLGERDEQTPEELNAPLPAPPVAPASLAGLAVLLVLCLVYLGAGLQQTGPAWKDGSALHYALHVDRWTDALGVLVREKVPAAPLAAWTKALRVAELAIPPLLLVPVARRLFRGLAVALMLFHGLTFGLLFTLGLYGWSLVAAAALAIPAESWDALRRGRRRVTIFYDDDCGFCLWCARLLRRLDLRDNCAFRANGVVEDLPPGVTVQTVEESIVVVDAGGRVHTDARALAEIVRALPLGLPVALLMRLPGIVHVGRRLYLRLARRRLDISVALGMGACGAALANGVASRVESDAAPTPTQRLLRGGRLVASSALALALLAGIVAQTEHACALPFETGLGQRPRWRAVALWARITADWGIFAPEPPRDNGAFVIDGETRGGDPIDVLSGTPPDVELRHPERVRHGQLWADYSARIQLEENARYRTELRRFLGKGGQADPTRPASQHMGAYEALWVSVPIPPPGEPRTGEVTRTRLITHGAKGTGRLGGGLRSPPLLTPR
jgi:predicted DCC family thiol-disulfide oxidoreductase YuxK